jgi:hypothetical protein
MTSTSSTGPVAFGCVGSFTLLESVFHKRAGALLHELSSSITGNDDYECRRTFVGGVEAREVKLHLPFSPRDSRVLWLVRQLLVRVNHHLLEQSVVILKTAGQTSNRYLLLPATEMQEGGPTPIAHRRMAVVSRTAKGKPSVMWYQVPIYEQDKIDTDTYGRAISMARDDGQEGNLMVFAENDADLLRDVVTKLEFDVKLTRRERTGGSTNSGKLVLFSHHRNGKNK